MSATERGLTRRDALRGLAAGAGLATLAGCASRVASAQRRPNVLLLYADQWRASDLGCAGNAEVTTPNVDRLASEGACYTRSFVNYPLCGPSRANLWTGQHSLRNGVIANQVPLRRDARTLARVLNATGYRSSYVGKWHLAGWPVGRFVPPGPERGGFDDLWALWGRPHQYFDSWYYLDVEREEPSEGYAPTRQTDVALERLAQHARSDADEPFFMVLGYGPPHPPYDAVPERFRSALDADALTLRPTNHAPWLPGYDEARVRGIVAGYYAACAALDFEIGRVLAFLDESGLADDTLVVFTSDHGGLLGEHGCFEKQQPFEEAIGVPLIVRKPGLVPAGSRPDTLISTVDVMPTLLGLLGVEAPADVDGVDLSWSARGESGEGPSSVYLQEVIGVGHPIKYGVHTWRGVRTERWKYAEDIDGPWQLYDLAADPHEMRNLVASSAHASARAELAAELRGWYELLGEQHEPAVEHLRDVGVEDAILKLLQKGLDLRPPDPDATLVRDYLQAGGGWGCKPPREESR